MANRLTFHCGYRNQLGKAYNSKHNQREKFAKPQKGDTPPPENVYWDYLKALGGETFSENEMAFYSRYLTPHIRRQNEKNKNRRQYGRYQTVGSYKEKHPPQESLIYLGTHDVDVAALEAVFKDYVTWLKQSWDKERGGVMPLNAALHLDETTPHIQFRQAYLYRDTAGDWQVSQNKALEVMGYERPDVTKPVGRQNNAKMTFTAVCREKLFELARSYGVELLTEPLPKDEVGLPLPEYIQRQQAREAWEAEKQAMEAQREQLTADVAELEDDKQDAAEELGRIRRNTGKELKAIEERRKKAQEQGYKDGFVLGAAQGERSALGQMNRRLREADLEGEEQEEIEHEGR